MKARETLVQMSVQDYANMSSGQRSEFHKKVSKNAYPDYMAVTITPGEMVAKLRNG